MNTLIATSIFVAGINGFTGHGLTTEQELGKKLFEDKNLSLRRNQACSSCHSLKPAHAKMRQTNKVAGFVDPRNVKTGAAVSAGSVRGATGTLNAPSAGYAAYSPELHWDDDEGLYIGGQFWNGRAANLAEQAKMPFVNPVEMAMPDAAALVKRIKRKAGYRRLFDKVYGIDLNDVAIPLQPNAEQTAKIEQVFDLVATAISRFEQSPVFNKFNSKFDYVLAGKTEFTPQERLGLEIFNGKANCAACHVSEATVDDAGNIQPPLFTDFSYDNIGLPRNINIPGNPEPDEGLGGQLNDPAEKGKHKVMSLRNIAITAPYGHNGSMATLEQIVHFYNTRDTLGEVDNINDPEFAKSGWPKPEIVDNLNGEELGNLGLTPEEEAALVAFLKTLTDDYPKWGHDPRVPRRSLPPFALPTGNDAFEDK